MLKKAIFSALSLSVLIAVVISEASADQKSPFSLNVNYDFISKASSSQNFRLNLGGYTKSHTPKTSRAWRASAGSGFGFDHDWNLGPSRYFYVCTRKVAQWCIAPSRDKALYYEGLRKQEAMGDFLMRNFERRFLKK